jgi:hypothetical protein
VLARLICACDEMKPFTSSKLLTSMAAANVMATVLAIVSSMLCGIEVA